MKGDWREELLLSNTYSSQSRLIAHTHLSTKSSLRPAARARSAVGDGVSLLRQESLTLAVTRFVPTDLLWGKRESPWAVTNHAAGI